jgi:uncharacterized protein
MLNNLSKYISILLLAILTIIAQTLVVNGEQISTLSKNNFQIAQTQSQDPDEQIIEAISLDQVETVKTFLNNGGNPNQYFKLAVTSGAMKSVEMMLTKGADINRTDEDGITPLMSSAQYTYRTGTKMTEYLLSRGARVNVKTKMGNTPLMFASWGVAKHYEDEYVKVVKILIAKGAKVNVKNKKGETPLTIATKGNWTKIIKTLKDAGAKG